ncbi:hypothetical protein [Hydrocarboniphaga effusa]|jgi:hypothetical protein|uniref:hypothetical protein n=1 Tax=Hydrocarboniphaga effusa TaxID=243629 RepID=UPI0031382A91
MSASTVILGTPDSGLREYGERLAKSANGVCLSDLKLCLAANVAELLQMIELAQEPIERSLLAALATHVPQAKRDAYAYLAERGDWTIATLLWAIVQGLAGRPLVIVDELAGFRIGETERWFSMQPQALFVHALTPRADFERASLRRYDTRLFVPPDYRDHNIAHPSPVLKPVLAWYQLHSTLARALADCDAVRRCRIEVGAEAPASLAALDTLASRQSGAAFWSWPFGRNGSAGTPTPDELERWLESHR